MDRKFYSLSADDVTHLHRNFDCLTFPNDFVLVYETQIPTAGIALIEGEIELLGRNSREVITTPTLIGIREILAGKPFQVTCLLKKNSKVVLLGKSELRAAIRKRTKLTRFMEGP